MAFILWFVITYLMADVMARGHDGDGSEDPPPPGGGRVPSEHQMDAVPTRRRRGRGKNLGLTTVWEDNGKRPLRLEFDPYTGTTIGHTHDLLIREASMYIWRDIALDRPSWDKVSDAEKNALWMHLQPYFAIDEILESSEFRTQREGLEFLIGRRYRGRKSDAKEHFMMVGGYDDLERAKGNPPSGMTDENWLKVVDLFTSDTHKKRSVVNKSNREKQTLKNLGGTSSYSNTAYKKSLDRIQAYREHHTKDGLFESATAEEHYNSLMREFVQQNEQLSSSANPTQVDEPALFEKVLGPRRGHIRGIGHKPSLMSCSSSHPSQQSSRHNEMDENMAMLRDSTFQTGLMKLMSAYKNRNRNNDENNDEVNDDENNDEGNDEGDDGSE